MGEELSRMGLNWFTVVDAGVTCLSISCTLLVTYSMCSPLHLLQEGLRFLHTLERLTHAQPYALGANSL